MRHEDVMQERLQLPEDVKASSLYSPDLAPLGWEDRTWNVWHIASLWVGMVVCIPTYMLASGMIQAGMNWRQAVFTVLLGNVIVLIPMILNSVAGTRYGISFPVLVRAPFGTAGTHIPSLMRGLVACGWFGIQTAIGGSAIFQLVEATRPGILANLADILPAWIGLSTGQAICFVVFWLINVYFILAGTESIKWLETIAAPLLIALGLALLYWAVWAGGSFEKILVAQSKFTTSREFYAVFWPNLTAMVGFWATLSLNIPDFSRHAKSQSDQIWGQAIGLPLPMALFAFIGVAATGASIVVYGEAIWDPVILLGKFQSPWIKGISLCAILIATLTTNIAANIVAPANALSNLAPKWISLRLGGLISALIGALMLPWKQLADPGGYIFTWLVGYSALLGPIAGIMIADYYFVQRGKLNLAELYREDSIYGRVNWKTLFVLVVAILPNLPGFLNAAFAKHDWVNSLPSFLVGLYPYAWFLGFGIAAILHGLFGRRADRSRGS
jgi:nucleobase:cation symporter-1, NCS1 family